VLNRLEDGLQTRVPPRNSASRTFLPRDRLPSVFKPSAFDEVQTGHYSQRISEEPKTDAQANHLRS